MTGALSHKLKITTNLLLFISLRNGVISPALEYELGLLTCLTMECSRRHVLGLAKLGHRKLPFSPEPLGKLAMGEASST